MQENKISASLILSISPLSLALNYLLQPNSLPHLLELGLAQRLGENVSQLVGNGNVVGLDAPFLQTVPR